jgi:nicotinamide mononucleotide transporter
MIITWILSNYIELIASALGIIYVILATKQNIWCWLAGIINVSLYIFVFLKAGLYGDMSLQIVYLFLSFYGWYNWKYGQSESNGKLAVTHVNRKSILVPGFLLIIMTTGFGYLLSFTNSDIPYWDALTTALGLLAIWMTARKILENWIVWIFTDLLCVGIYLYKDLYPTAVFYLIMSVLAVFGYLEWKKQMRNITE